MHPASFHSAAEFGIIGIACGNPAHTDKVQLTVDQVPSIQGLKNTWKDALEVDSLPGFRGVPHCLHTAQS